MVWAVALAAALGRGLAWAEGKEWEVGRGDEQGRLLGGDIAFRRTNRKDNHQVVRGCYPDSEQ